MWLTTGNGVQNAGILYILSSILTQPKRTQQNKICAKKKLLKFLVAHCLKPEIEQDENGIRSCLKIIMFLA